MKTRFDQKINSNRSGILSGTYQDSTGAKQHCLMREEEISMKTLLKTITLTTLAATLAATTGISLAQTPPQTPLAQPLVSRGSVTPDNSSSCGFIAGNPTQVLEVAQDFASLTITASGDSGIALWIEGSNGFTECHTTNAASGNTIHAPGLLNQGTYSFYIGNANSVPTTYTLTIEQN
jgi:hypothetical protein